MDNFGNGKPAVDTAAMIARLAGMIGKEHVADDYVRFRIEVVKAQEAALAALTGAASPHSHEKDEISIDAGVLADYFTQLSSAITQLGTGDSDIGRLINAFNTDNDMLEKLTHDVGVKRELEYATELADKLEVPSDALSLVAQLLAAPFAQAYAEKHSAADQMTKALAVDRCHCPICGAEPALTKLIRDEGERMVYCSLCGYDWPAPRIQCCYCGTEDQQHLGVLFVGKVQKRHWVETCDACKRYIKCFDERHYPTDESVSPFVDDTATIFLDLVAEKEGYTQRLPYVALK